MIDFRSPVPRRGGGIIACLMLVCVNASTGIRADDLSSETVAPPHVSSVESRAAIERGVRWLLAQQSEDGGWRSETYGALRPGVGVTAITLSALRISPLAQDDAVRTARARGVRFLTRRFAPDGMVCAPDGTGDSPVYATALLLSVLAQDREESQHELRQQLSRALLQMQRLPATGFPADSPHLGGWGPDSGTPNELEAASPANISVTAHVLEALRQADTLTPETRASALEFLHRCRGGDEASGRASGWGFTPVAESPFNKGGWISTAEGPRPRAYHSATCDGYLALSAAGLTDEAPLMSDTRTALAALPPPQLDDTHTETAALLSGLYYYNAAALADVWQRTRDERLSSRVIALQTDLITEQRSDGSWASPHGWMREQDPLIATALAVLALSRLQPRAVPPP